MQNKECNPLISVIIPVYNVEKYLEQCLNSVVNQSYKNLEIICINDCSEDNCSEILNGYAKNDNRIVIVNNTDNIGLGSTRNVGLNIANGEYIHFLDADDWLELNAYEVCADIIKNNKIDIIKFLYKSINMINNAENVSFKVPEQYENNAINIYTHPTIINYWTPTAWSKIMRKDFLKENNLMFPDKRCFEDVEYALYALFKAKNIYCINKVLLNYRENRTDSLLSKKNTHLNTIIDDVKTVNELVQNQPEPIKENTLNFIYDHLIRNTLSAYLDNAISLTDAKQILKNNVDYEILKKHKNAKYYLSVYNGLLFQNHFLFKYKQIIKKFIKTYFPSFTNFCLKIKSFFVL